ncbi:MAG: hypothetical protein KDA37_16720, partial [Planctomycetales bacterium]|nr:hypothetical protein [Planctomycetales bacterium]
MKRILLLLPVLNLLTLSPVGRAEEASRELDALPIFTCQFGEDVDKNYDLWPDRWTRDISRKYPHYVEMKITDDEAVKPGRCLQILLDGANARVSSPPISVIPKFSYTLSLKLKTTGIEQSRVWVSIDFMTPDGKVVQTHRSQAFRSTDKWVEVSIDKHRPLSAEVDRVVAHVEVERGVRGDLQGEVRIAEVWLGRWPSMEVTTNSRFNVYDNPDNVVVTCALSGVSEQNPTIKFQLLDATQAELGEEGSEQLNGRVIDQASMNSLDILEGAEKHLDGFEGATTWRPDIRGFGGFGFYRVRVQMVSSQTGGIMDERTITLAIVPPKIKSSAGEFGWSLPETVASHGEPLDFATLQELLPLAGVSWVKLPVWFPPDQDAQGDKIIQFAERLAAADIETIGIIQEPRTDQSPSRLNPEESQIEFVFRQDSSVWLKYYDHVMNRLSLRLRWWQLGYDHDTSFVGHEDLVPKIAEIRRNLYRFGQDIRLGLGWRWDHEPIEGQRSWDFEQFSSDPPLQSEQLGQHLLERPNTGAPRWVLIEPDVEADGVEYATRRELHEARVKEFIKQIVVSKRRGAEGIFIAEPFTGPHGVMNTDGTPGELLLPWRTSASLLGGARYIGTLRLPQGSQNWLFKRPDSRVVMVAWNDTETDEVLYLGGEVVQLDVWGQRKKPELIEHRQVIHVGPQPTFLLGVNEAIARWRMSVVFEREALPSVFGVEHENALNFVNSFPFGVGGTVSFFVPNLLREDDAADYGNPGWEIWPEEGEIKSAAGLAMRHPMTIKLKNAPYGEQPIRIDFNLNEGAYKFSVWRTLRVGLGDLEIQASTRIDDKGRLIVQQRMVNLEGQPVDFKCMLSAEKRRRKKAQVFQLGAEPDIKSYIYTNGEDLLGKDFTLEIQEV